MTFSSICFSVSAAFIVNFGFGKCQYFGAVGNRKIVVDDVADSHFRDAISDLEIRFPTEFEIERPGPIRWNHNGAPRTGQTRPYRQQRSTTPINNKPTLMTAFTLKNAKLTRDRSVGRTSQCS